MERTKFIKNNTTYKTKSGYPIDLKIINNHKIIGNVIETYLPINILTCDLSLNDIITPFLLEKHGFKKKPGSEFYIRKHLAVAIDIEVRHYELKTITSCMLIDYLLGSTLRFPKQIKYIYELNNLYKSIEQEDILNYS